jgi:hypothetical protein
LHLLLDGIVVQSFLAVPVVFTTPRLMEETHSHSCGLQSHNLLAVKSILDSSCCGTVCNRCVGLPSRFMWWDSNDGGSRCSLCCCCTSGLLTLLNRALVEATKPLPHCRSGTSMPWAGRLSTRVAGYSTTSNFLVNVG